MSVLIPLGTSSEAPTQSNQHYLDRLYSVRAMPQESSEELGQKRLEAMKLRMDTHLANAQCWGMLMEELHKNPLASEHYLQRQIDQIQNLRIHPQTRQELSYSLHLQAANLQQEVQDMAPPLDYDEAGIALGRYFYHIYAGYPPQNPVTYIKTPFSITIVVSQKDFAKIDPNKNVGGFFITSRDCRVYSAKEHRVVVKSLPFAVVKEGYFQDRILKHELRHASDQVFSENMADINSNLGARLPGVVRISALSPTLPVTSISAEKDESTNPVKTTWGFDEERYGVVFLKKDVKLLQKLSENPVPELTNGEVVESSKAKARITQYALIRAKSEILSAMQEGEIGRASQHLETLKIQHDPKYKDTGIYDYFHELGIPLKSALYKDLSTEYHAQLDKMVERAMEVHDFYTRSFSPGYREVLKTRARLFTNFLAQNPMETWNSRIESSGFLMEMHSLTSFDQASRELIDLLTAPPSVLKNFPDESYSSLYGLVSNLISSFHQELKMSPDKNYFSIVRDYEKRLQDLRSKAEKTPTFQAMQIVNKLQKFRDQVFERVISTDAIFELMDTFGQDTFEFTSKTLGDLQDEVGGKILAAQAQLKRDFNFEIEST